MVGIFLVFIWGDTEQFFFNFNDRFARRQAGSVAETEDVRIDGDRGLAKGRVEHDIGRFAADTGQGFELAAILGNLASVLFKQNAASGNDVFCLGVVETDGPDVLTQTFDVKRVHFFRCRCNGKQFSGGFVDANVSCLR